MRLIAAFALTFLFCTALALPAGDPAGFHYWSASELKGFSKSLAPKVNAQKIATEQLGAVGNYSFMVAHREGSGEAEYHENQADIFVVQAGSGTLVYGGSMVDAKTTAPHEMRGPSISGGMEKKISAGDVLTIPAKMPHLLKVDQEITYFVVKVTQ